MGSAVIVEAVRTPIGRRNGWLSGLHAAELLGAAQRALVERAGSTPRSSSRSSAAASPRPASSPNNVTRTAWLHAGLPGRPAPHHRRPVRLGPAGQPPDRRPDRRRRDRRRHRLRRRGDVAASRSAPTAARPGSPAARTPGTSTCPNQFDAAERIAAPPRPDPRGPRRLRAALAAARPSTPGTRAASTARSRRSSAGARRDGKPTGSSHGHARRGPARDDRRGPRRAAAGLDGGLHTAGTSSQISDGAAAVLLMDEAKGAGPRPAPRARIVAQCLVGAEPVLPPGRPGAGHQPAARAQRMTIARHRPVRGQRGVRVGPDVLAAGARRRPGQAQRQRRRDRARPPGRQHRRRG